MKSGNQTRIEDLTDLVPPGSDMTSSTLRHHVMTDSGIYSDKHNKTITEPLTEQQAILSSIK